MHELLGSSLMRAMRDSDPRRWLAYGVTAALDELQTNQHKNGDALIEVCISIRAKMRQFPSGDIPRREAERLVKHVEKILHELSRQRRKTARTDPLAAAASAEEPEDESSRYSLTPGRSSDGNAARPSQPTPSQPHPEPRISEPPISDRPGKLFGSDTPLAPTTLTPMPPVSSAPPENRSAPAQDASAPPQDKPTPPPADVTTLAEREPAAPAAVESAPGSSPIMHGASDRLGPFSTELIAVDDRDLSALDVVARPRSEQAEAYRELFFRIGATDEVHSIMVTSPDSADQAALCAANLALAIDDGSEQSVLLIEASFKEPRIARLFDYEPSESFGRRLATHRKNPRAPWRLAQLEGTKLNILAPRPSSKTRPALDSKALAEVIDAFLEGGVDYVVVVGPPTAESSDAPYIARCVDGIVMTVRAGDTRGRALRRGVASLGAVPMLGYVLFD